MSNVQVQFKRGNTTTLNNTPYTDGMIYFNTENQRIYMDNESNRIEYANNMSNFMDKLDIDNIVNKSLNNARYLVPFSEMNAVIGNTNIGNNSIINTINTLYQNKTLFQEVWSDNAHMPFTSKSIITEGIYPFYIIFFGSYVSELVYNENTDSYEETLVWKQGSDIFEELSSYYHIVLNDNIVYTKNNIFDNNISIADVRRIQITSNASNNTTTFNFGNYGSYFNGQLINSSDTDKEIPIAIIGIDT